MERIIPNVYVLNESAHDFSDAERFGNLVFLSTGKMNRYGICDMHREFIEKLKDSQPDDYILPTGLAIMSMVAAAIFGKMHRRLNLLLFKNDRYIERRIVL